MTKLSSHPSVKIKHDTAQQPPEWVAFSRNHILSRPNTSGRLECSDEFPAVPMIEVYAAR